MFKVMVPLINSATTSVASPTLFSSVVLVVEKPRSWIMMVEKELMTPLGMALVQRQTLKDIRRHKYRSLRCEDRNENQDHLRICERLDHLLLVEGLVFDSSLIGSHTPDSDKSLSLIEKLRICRCVCKYKVQDKGPETCGGTELKHVDQYG